jgi:hypothetical protein
MRWPRRVVASTAVEEADELRRVLLRLYEAISSRDTEAIVHRFSVVAGLVRDLTESTGEFTFGDAAEVELKGLSGTHRVFELVS